MDELISIFRALGVDDPEGWAASQAAEGIPQLHRLLFLRRCWSEVVDEADDSWIDRSVEAWRAEPAEPFAASGRAIAAMLEKGVDRAHIVDLVRTTQAEALASFCGALDGQEPDEDDERLEGVCWSLVVADAEGTPTGPEIPGLHESVLETDPSGREMRPR